MSSPSQLKCEYRLKYRHVEVEGQKHHLRKKGKNRQRVDYRPTKKKYRPDATIKVHKNT